MPAARKQPAEKPAEAITPVPTAEPVPAEPAPFPDYSKFPDLSKVADEKDFCTRVIGHEKYPNGEINYDKPVEAKYLNHATVSRLLKLHAPGWEFELKPYVDANGIESDVWPAPNGSGYLKGFFRAPVGSGFKDTTCYPYAITNNRNKPLAANLLSCTDICNSERRALAACAARFFSLAWDAWATDHTQDEHAAPDNFVQQEQAPEPVKQVAPMSVAPVTASAPVAMPKAVTATKAESVPAPAAVESLQARVNGPLLGEFKTCWGFDNTVFDRWQQDFKLAFNLSVEQPNVSEIQTEQQFAWCTDWLQMERQKIQGQSKP